MKYSGEEQKLIRIAIFDWLTEQSKLKIMFTRQDLRSEFVWKGEVIPLMDLQKGIWNPRDFEHTLSITSTYDNPYGDYRGESDELLNYKYQSSTTGAGTNTKLRAAFEQNVPLVLFEEIERGKYIANFPVYVKNDFRQMAMFQIDLTSVPIKTDEEFTFTDIPLEKAYAERQALQRLHQPKFRARVLSAYEGKCSICNLKHVELLDAAHIIPDARENGFATVNNGLALCKIHHTAYDRDVIGITPDYIVEVKQSVMAETDGPMLEYGIKRMNGVKLQLPRSQSQHPLKENLEQRYSQFMISQ